MAVPTLGDSMKAVLPLPVADPLAEARPRLQVHAPERVVPLGLPRVELVPSPGSVLHSSPMGDGPDVLSLNLARGCGQRCAFCSARAYVTYPGDQVLYLFEDVAEKLAAELAARRKRPRAVYVCPSTDPFPPLAPVQATTARVVEVLAQHGVDAWLMTRGFIRPSVLDVLAEHRERVKVLMGLTTLDRTLQRTLEALAAPPRRRLRQLAELRRLGIAVQVALEPLVPGVTDTRANLEPLLRALADLGIGHVTAGYLFLRSRIRENLLVALEPFGWDGPVLDAFREGPMLENGGIAPARYLAKARRQRGYAALMALAAGFGITVSVSGVSNPDFRAQPAADDRPRQRLLPYFEGSPGGATASSQGREPLE
jgi:DNA repair photolyase